MKAVFSYVQALVMVMVAVFLLSFTTNKPLSNEESEKGTSELHFAGKLENLPVFRLAIKNSNLSRNSYSFIIQHCLPEIFLSL